jgi:predicted lipid-binding transport protein (Tim44 family)
MGAAAASGGGCSPPGTSCVMEPVRDRGWLPGWLGGLLAGWLAGRLAGWLAGRLAGRLACCSGYTNKHMAVFRFSLHLRYCFHKSSKPKLSCTVLQQPRGSLKVQSTSTLLSPHVFKAKAKLHSTPTTTGTDSVTVFCSTSHVL